MHLKLLKEIFFHISSKNSVELITPRFQSQELKRSFKILHMHMRKFNIKLYLINRLTSKREE